MESEGILLCVPHCQSAATKSLRRESACGAVPRAVTAKKSRPRTCKVPPRRSRGGTLQVPRPTFREVARKDHARGTSCTSYHKNFPTEK